jgi:hypothetical protein
MHWCYCVSVVARRGDSPCIASVGGSVVIGFDAGGVVEGELAITRESIVPMTRLRKMHNPGQEKAGSLDVTLFISNILQASSKMSRVPDTCTCNCHENLCGLLITVQLTSLNFTVLWFADHFRSQGSTWFHIQGQTSTTKSAAVATEYMTFI